MIRKAFRKEYKKISVIRFALFTSGAFHNSLNKRNYPLTYQARHKIKWYLNRFTKLLTYKFNSIITATLRRDKRSHIWSRYSISSLDIKSTLMVDNSLWPFPQIIRTDTLTSCRMYTCTFDSRNYFHIKSENLNGNI